MARRLIPVLVAGLAFAGVTASGGVSSGPGPESVVPVLAQTVDSGHLLPGDVPPGMTVVFLPPAGDGFSDGGDGPGGLEWVIGDGFSDGGFGEIELELERAQRHVALRVAFRELRPRCQELLSQLFQEPRPAYRDISATLGMKIGSIGPSRERCLAELRRCPPVAALIEADGSGREARLP